MSLPHFSRIEKCSAEEEAKRAKRNKKRQKEGEWQTISSFCPSESFLPLLLPLPKTEN
jgi:hypothetical protein